MRIVCVLTLILLVVPILSVGSQEYDENLVLSAAQTPVSDKWFIVTDHITAGNGFSVTGGTDVRLIAGNSITIDEVFSVMPGSTFTAAIGQLDGEVIDEDTTWTSDQYIAGDLVIGDGTGQSILDIQDSSDLYFLDGGSLIVNDELLATGSAFGSALGPDGNWLVWGGIRTSGILSLEGCYISGAPQGVLVLDGRADIHNSTITNTQVGVHIFDYLDPPQNVPLVDVTPSISRCFFQNNELYAIKEDNVGNSMVNKTTFISNGHIYYDLYRATLDIDELNSTLNNWDNTEQ